MYVFVLIVCHHCSPELMQIVPPTGSSPGGAIGNGWTNLDGWGRGCATFYIILFKHMIPGGCQFSMLCQWMDQQGMRSKYALIKLKRFVQLEEGDIVGEDAGIESLMLEETLNCKSSHHNHFSTPSDI